MPLGFGDNVARLSATLTLDDDGFVKGMAEASAKMDAYNARLKEEGVTKRLATMASRDYARQLYNEARGVDQATQSHNRLITTLRSARQHWKLLSVSAAGATVGIAALTGHLGTLANIAIPAVNGALTGLLSPFTAVAAIVVGMVGPLSALVTLFGAVGGGVGLGLYTALTSNTKAFKPLREALKGAKQDFNDLGHELGVRFLPYIMGGVQWVDRFLKYADKLAHMTLPQVIESISTRGMKMLEQLNRQIYNVVGKPLLEIFSASFGKAGNRISGAFAHILDVWRPLAGRMWGIFAGWFDKQHFEQTGATWAAAIVSTALPIIAKGMLHSLEAVFENSSFWGKVGVVAGTAFAANFFTRGLLAKGLLAGGKGLIGLFGGAAAGAGAVGAGEAVAGGGAAAGGGGIIAMLGGAAGIAAIAGVAVPAALVYLSSHQSAASQNKFGAGPGITPRGPGSPGYLPDNIRQAAGQDAEALKKVAAAEKQLNQYIKDGGKSVLGWKVAVGQATHQANQAQAAINDMAKKGIISTDQAAQQSKANLQNYINQEDEIARKATVASRNTAQFGASTRAQYAHVAALAKTSADLAAAINSIPSQKYVSLVLSITENLKTQGLAPGQGGAGGSAHSNHATGGVITGGAANRDSVHAMLTPGEVVLSKKAIAQHFGGNPYAADALNFATGGLVPPKRHKKEKRNAYRSRVSNWLSNTVGSRFNQLDFALQIADRVAQRDDSEGKYGAEITQLNREQKIRAEEISLYARGRHVAHRFGLIALERQFGQAAAFIHQDILDTAQTIRNLRGQGGGGVGSGVGVAQQIAAFLAEQQAFISQYASNIQLPGAATNIQTSGTPIPGGGGSGGRSRGGPRVPNRTLPGGGGVVIHNHFTQTPPDSFVHIRKARIQAAAVFG